MNVFDLVGTFAVKGVDEATGQISSATTEAKTDFSKMGKGAKSAADDVEKGMDEAGDSTEKASGRANGASVRFRSAMGSIAEGAKSAGAAAAKGLAAITVAAAGVVTGLSALAGESMEYTESSSRLAVAADAVGVSQERATATYRDFLGLVGDSDQATEATQDMLNLAQAGGDIDAWYKIAAGSVARFGDALPVENLIESANETIRTGQIVGSMADAVNWASASAEQWESALGQCPAALDAFNAAIAEGLSAEDAFNAALSACSDEAERAAITQAALNEIYGETGQAYLDANQKIIDARKAEDDWAASTAAAGDAVLPLRTAVLGLGADLVGKLIPGLVQAGDGLAGMFDGTDGAAERFTQGVTDALSQLIQGLSAMLPALLQIGASILSGLAMGLINAIPGFVQALGEFLPQLVTMMTELLVQIVNQLTAMFPVLMPQLLQAAIGLLMAIVQAVPQILPPLIAAIPMVVQTVCELLPTFIPVLLEAAVQLFMALVDCLPQIIDALLAALPAVIGAVISLLPTFIPALMSAAQRLFMAIVQAVPTVLGSLLASVGSLMSQVPGKVLEFVPKMMEAGRSIIGGLVDGIKGMASAAVDAVWGLLSSIRDLLPFSPAKEGPFSGRGWTLYSGMSIVEALADGMVAKASVAVGAMRAVMDDAASELSAEAFESSLAMDAPLRIAAHSGQEAPGAQRDEAMTLPDALGFLESFVTRLEDRPIVVSIKADDRELARVIRRYAPC